MPQRPDPPEGPAGPEPERPAAQPPTAEGTVAPAVTAAAVTAADYVELERSPEFGRLRRSFRGFAFPVTIGFIAWYLLYVLLSNYAAGFMDTQVVGHNNVAFVLGLAQFATTFAIAAWYSRYANKRLDPLATELREGHRNGTHTETAGE